MRLRSVAVFVKALWELVGGGKQLGLAYDQPSISFPSSVINLLTLTHSHSSCPDLPASSLPRSDLAPIAISSRRPTRSKGSSQEWSCRTSRYARTTSRRSRIRLSNTSARSCTSRRSLRLDKLLQTSSRRSEASVLTASAQRLKSRSNGSDARSRRRRRGVGVRTRGRARTRRCTSSRLSRRAAGL